MIEGKELHAFHPTEYISGATKMVPCRTVLGRLCFFLFFIFNEVFDFGTASATPEGRSCAEPSLDRPRTPICRQAFRCTEPMVSMKKGGLCLTKNNFLRKAVLAFHTANVMPEGRFYTEPSSDSPMTPMAWQAFCCTESMLSAKAGASYLAKHLIKHD